ncbi:MAG: ATPase, T2SS/T4P/T4SS family [Candidatus Tectimicrobiota bacterium]
MMSENVSPVTPGIPGLTALSLAAERRRAARLPRDGVHVARFTCQARDYHGHVQDVSALGAGVCVEVEADSLHLEPGTVLTLTLSTPHGSLRRAGRVAWSSMRDTQYRFGVAFVLYLEDAADSALLDVEQIKIDPLLALRLPPGLALRRQLLPFAARDGYAYVACADPQDMQALQAVERFVNLPVRPEAAEPESLQRVLRRIYGEAESAGNLSAAPRRLRLPDVRTPAAELEGDYAVGLCEELLQAALVRQASDIHLDPGRAGLQVRLRVDGVLERHHLLPMTVHAALISRLKVLGGMDIAEKRAPQDGGFTHRFGATGQSVDVRLATLPTKYGERLTVRLLALHTESLTLERLGMGPGHLASMTRCLDQPQGLVLLTGPTGSGKTTTLYAAIRRLVTREELNIITVEDPIEYDIAGVAQVEVDAVDKVSFSKALRSILRHDPDVVMIGEVRDYETADVAIKAALTGHLVLSTLHTNSAASAITRLADMGVERYLIAATLRLAVAQRLVRRLCRYCRQPYLLNEEDAVALGQPAWVGETLYQPGGCQYCAGSGYVGRLGLYELLPLDASWSHSIVQGADESALLDAMRQRKLMTLLDDAHDKLVLGLTSVREVLLAIATW